MVVETMTNPWQRARAAVAARRGLAIQHNRAMLSVLEEIPRALERCMEDDDGTYKQTIFYTSGGSIDWNVASMRHWKIEGPSVWARTSLFQRLTEHVPTHGRLNFWLREDGEIVYSSATTEYRQQVRPPMTQRYALGVLATDQLEAMFHGLRAL